MTRLTLRTTPVVDGVQQASVVPSRSVSKASSRIPDRPSPSRLEPPRPPEAEIEAARIEVHDLYLSDLVPIMSAPESSPAKIEAATRRVIEIVGRFDDVTECYLLARPLWVTMAPTPAARRVLAAFVARFAAPQEIETSAKLLAALVESWKANPPSTAEGIALKRAAEMPYIEGLGALAALRAGGCPGAWLKVIEQVQRKAERERVKSAGSLGASSLPIDAQALGDTWAKLATPTKARAALAAAVADRFSKLSANDPTCVDACREMMALCTEGAGAPIWAPILRPVLIRSAERFGALLAAGSSAFNLDYWVELLEKAHTLGLGADLEGKIGQAIARACTTRGQAGDVLRRLGPTPAPSSARALMAQASFRAAVIELTQARIERSSLARDALWTAADFEALRRHAPPSLDLDDASIAFSDRCLTLSKASLAKDDPSLWLRVACWLDYCGPTIGGVEQQRALAAVRAQAIDSSADRLRIDPALLKGLLASLRPDDPRPSGARAWTSTLREAATRMIDAGVPEKTLRPVLEALVRIKTDLEWRRFAAEFPWWSALKYDLPVAQPQLQAKIDALQDFIGSPDRVMGAMQRFEEEVLLEALLKKESPSVQLEAHLRAEARRLGFGEIITLPKGLQSDQDFQTMLRAGSIFFENPSSKGINTFLDDPRIMKRFGDDRWFDPELKSWRIRHGIQPHALMAVLFARDFEGLGPEPFTAVDAYKSLGAGSVQAGKLVLVWSKLMDVGRSSGTFANPGVLRLVANEFCRGLGGLL